MKIPLRIYNRFLDFQAEIDTYQSLQFGRDFHGVGDFELHINRYMHEAKKLEKGNLIALNKQSNKAAVIMTKEIALDEKGKETENFKLAGYVLDGLMNRRITVPPSHTSHDRKSGNVETVMKHYVYNHFVNPVDPSRKMPHVEVAPDLNRGEHIEWESRYKNIADELENISIKTGLGWGLFANFKTKKLIFDVIEAKDLTQDNPYGNYPVFFSPEFETIKSQGFINSDNDLRNVGYVGGQGEGAEREIITLGNNAGWDRIETFIDARDVGGTDTEELSPEEIKQQLEERGQSKMRDMESIYTLEAEILTPSQESPFQYGKDFDLGDKVQVVNKSWGLQMTAPITQFKEIHEQGGFRLEATFGRSCPTLISKMKNKFDELQGVEKQELPALIAVETKQYANQKVSEEEQKRIEQAKENLKNSKQYTEEYAEKKRVESSTEPEDKTVIWVDNSDPDNVVWKIWSEADGIWKEGPGGPQGPQGIQGLQGPRGDQGIRGEMGADGRTAYTHIAYANDEEGNGFSQSSANKAYIGMYADHTPTDSANPADYNWTLIKGADGSQGLPGPKGDDGRTPYFHTAWANNSTGTSGFSTTVSDGKLYIGTYTDFSSADSTDPTQYKWMKVKGDVGSTGSTGPKGPKGDTGAQGPNIVDTNTSFGVNWLVADYIKSLNGLNVGNGQFVVDGNGNVSIANDNVQIDRGGVAVKDGSFYLEDTRTGLKNHAVFKTNMLKDHSFESMGVDYSANHGNLTYDAVSNVPNEWSGWFVDVGSPRITTTYYTQGDASLDAVMFGFQSLVVNTVNYAYQSVILDGGNRFTVSVHARKAKGHTAGKLKLSFGYYDGGNNKISQDYHDFPIVNSEEHILRYSATGTTPSGTHHVRVYMYATDSGWVSVDGAQMVLGDTPTLYNPEDSLTQFMAGFTRAKRLYADELEATTIAFQHRSSADFDQYGNIGAKASATPGSYWNIKDYKHDVIFKAPWGSDGGPFEIRQTGFYGASLTNGWSNYGSSFASAGYMKDSDGFVNLRGMIKNGTKNEPAFTLPSGYRPYRTMGFSAVDASNGPGARINVYSSGSVQVRSGDSEYIILDGVRFWAEG